MSHLRHLGARLGTLAAFGLTLGLGTFVLLFIYWNVTPHAVGKGGHETHLANAGIDGAGWGFLLADSWAPAFPPNVFKVAGLGEGHVAAVVFRAAFPAMITALLFSIGRFGKERIPSHIDPEDMRHNVGLFKKLATAQLIACAVGLVLREILWAVRPWDWSFLPSKPVLFFTTGFMVAAAWERTIDLVFKGLQDAPD